MRRWPEQRAAGAVLAVFLWAFGGCGAARPLDFPLVGGGGVRVHPAGVLDPQDPVAFHGVLLRQLAWDFNACASCHGKDLQGGAGPSCLKCHPAGPTACATCHGDRLLKSGAHALHVHGGLTADPLDCSECHDQPRDYRDPGHLFNADGSVKTGDIPVPVRFGVLASATPPSAQRGGPPGFDPDTRRCANVYCHGAVYPDADGSDPVPLWLPEAAAHARCGTCHALPPKDHPAGRCVQCHNRTVDAAGQLLPGGLHLRGRPLLGDGSDKCWACHGSAGSVAPPRDLLGNTDVSALGVGVHRSHTEARHRLRGPLGCGECHTVPERVDSPGHLGDGPAPVVFGALGMADGAAPAWDHDNARCTGVYCHGAGHKLGRDGAAGLLRAPLWTREGQAYCGSCHGIPPQDPAHTPDMRLGDCARCHPATIDASGTIIVSGPPGSETSAHMNGVVDVR